MRVTWMTSGCFLFMNPHFFVCLFCSVKEYVRYRIIWRVINIIHIYVKQQQQKTPVDPHFSLWIFYTDKQKLILPFSSWSQVFPWDSVTTPFCRTVIIFRSFLHLFLRLFFPICLFWTVLWHCIVKLLSLLRTWFSTVLLTFIYATKLCHCDTSE